jgi:hypothetical protein
MANFPTIGLGQAGQNAFNNKWAGYTPPVAPAPTPTAPTQQSTAPKPPTLPTQPAQQGATVIPVTTMGSQQQINIPTQQQPMTAPVTMNYADQLMQQANADTQNTQVQDYQNQSIMQMLDAYNNLAGESAYRTQATQDSNINGLKQNLQNINNQILTKQAEIQQDDVRLAAGLNNIEKKAIPMEFITGQQQSVQRDAQIARALKMSEIGVLNAQVLAGQGNIELAQKTVDEAVAAKFAPYKEFIDIRQKQLDAIAPLLSKAEAKQAAAQKLKTDLSLRKLDKLESDEKDAQKAALTAGSNGAPASLVAKMAQAKNLSEALAIGGQYMSDPLDRAIKSAQLRKLNLENAPQQVADKVFSTTEKIANIDGMLSNNAGIRGSAGPTRLQRGGILTVVPRGKLNADIQQLISQTTLDNLINAKAKGATFGALSEGELKLLSASGSKLATWAITDKNGNIEGFKASEKQVRDELNKIRSYATRDYELTTGQKYAPITEDSFVDSIISSSASSPFASLGATQ